MKKYLNSINKPLCASVLCHSIFILSVIVYGFLPKPKEFPIKPASKVIEVSFYSNPKPQPVAARTQEQTKPQQKKQAQQPKPIIKQIVKSVIRPTPKIIHRKKAEFIKKIVAVKPKTSDAYSPPQKVNTHTQQIASVVKHSESSSVVKPQSLASTQPSFNKNNYIALVKGKIASHKFYPISAKRRGTEGRVGLNLSIAESGHIYSVHITHSSGSDILDSAAIECVRKAAPFKPTSQRVTFNFGISYSLNEG